LIGHAIEVGVNIAVDLDAVLEIAPLVDLVIAVGIEESAQQFVGVRAHDPAGNFAAFGGDFALADQEFVRGIVFDPLLNRRQPQGLLRGGRCRAGETRESSRTGYGGGQNPSHHALHK
jgi:hypothetical protein